MLEDTAYSHPRNDQTEVLDLNSEDSGNDIKSQSRISYFHSINIY